MVSSKDPFCHGGKIRPILVTIDGYKLLYVLFKTVPSLFVRENETKDLFCQGGKIRPILVMFDGYQLLYVSVQNSSIFVCKGTLSQNPGLTQELHIL